MKSRLSRRLPAAAGTLLLACHAHPLLAQPTTQLEPVTVIGSRTAQPVDDVLGDVTVIEREAIERAGSQSVAELLSRSPGIEFANNGGPQTVTSLFVRGANPNQTLILVDGLRINPATSGGGALNAFALDDIERIEILRGAASSLYGADAVGGVINIVTRQGADRPFAPYASIGAGTRGTARAAAGVAGSNAGWRYAVNAAYGQSKGFDATTPANPYSHNPDRDSYYQRNVSASLGYTWSPGHEISANAFHSRVNGGYDAGAPYVNDRSIQTVEGFSIASRNRLSDRWTSTLRLGSTLDEVRSENAPAALVDGNAEDGVTRFRTRQNQYAWQNEFALAPAHRLTLAVERLEQRVAGDISDWSTWPPAYVDYPTTRRNTNSLTGVYTGSFGRHHLQASVRHDDDSQYGGETTGGAAYGFDLAPGLRATIAANTAFRAPSFNELYYPGGGNPDLEPETSRNVEAGLRWQRGGTELGATVYRNRVTNLITGWPAENVGRAVLRGVTFTGAHRFGDTSLRASLDLQDPHNADTGDQLPLRARRIFRLGADHRIGAATVGADWYVSSERHSSAGERLAGYGLLDLVASYDMNRDTRVQVRWSNVFDKDYTLNPGYATPGSAVFVNLAWRPR